MTFRVGFWESIRLPKVSTTLTTTTDVETPSAGKTLGSIVRVVVSKNVGKNSTFAVATRGTPLTFAVIYLVSDLVDVTCATVLPYKLVKVSD